MVEVVVGREVDLLGTIVGLPPPDVGLVVLTGWMGRVLAVFGVG